MVKWCLLKCVSTIHAQKSILGSSKLKNMDFKYMPAIRRDISLRTIKIQIFSAEWFHSYNINVMWLQYHSCKSSVENI